MNSIQQFVDKMNHLLDDLVRTAKKLKTISERVVLEEELKPLQDHQDDLLGQLTALDRDLKTYYESKITPEVHAQFHKKLEEFQNLNQDFINNINGAHGLIQFDLHQKKDSPKIEKSLPQKKK